MKISSTLIAGFLCAAASASCTASGPNIERAQWKWTGPADAQGGFNGVAVELPFGEHPPYAITRGDGLVLSAPTSGAHTKGSHYPRSELREIIGGKLAAWFPEKGTHKLEVTLSVDELPQTDQGVGRVVIGQIHGPDDELTRLYYDGSPGRIYFHDDKAGSSQQEVEFPLLRADGTPASIPLGAVFTYLIEVNDALLHVRVTYKGEAYDAMEKLSPFWQGKPCYFKAGVYVQAGKEGSGAGTIGTGRGTVTISRVLAVHG